MDRELGITRQRSSLTDQVTLPAVIHDAGPRARKRFVEFFTAQIANDNTRAAYARAVRDFFVWCEDRGVGLLQVEPVVVAAYVKGLEQGRSVPTVKQHLAAIRMLFDWLVTGHVVDVNPASSVRTPKHVVMKGKTPILTAEDMRTLFDSIDVGKIVGLRDRAMIGMMVYSFARVGALISMGVEDYYVNGKKWWFRLHEKGGRFLEVPAHHTAEAYMDAYIEAGGIKGQKKRPLFRRMNRSHELAESAMDRREVWEMIKRRAKAAGLTDRLCNHSFRGTGITIYLLNGGSLEHAQRIAGHASPRATKLYDRTSDTVSLDEIEKIVI